jgi:DNA-binding transcriptional LysR family regulator
MRFCIVASPGHECTNHRSADTNALYRWEFEKGDERIRIAVAGRIATNDNDLLLQSALDGFGFSYLQHRTAAPHIQAGRLVRPTPVAPPVITAVFPFSLVMLWILCWSCTRIQT